jgi:hypothetical protein
MCIIYPVKNSESEIKHGCITIQSSTQDPIEKMLKNWFVPDKVFFLVIKEDDTTSAYRLG